MIAQFRKLKLIKVILRNGLFQILSKLAKDTTKKYERNNVKRKEPRVFLNYLSTSKAGEKNWNIALKNNTWGVNEKDLQRSSKQILDVKKGTLFYFFMLGQKTNLGPTLKNKDRSICWFF